MDDLGVGAGLAHGLDHPQAGAVLQPHVQDGEGRREDLHRRQRRGDAADQDRLEAASLQCASEARAQGAVVIHEQQALVGQRGDLGAQIGHSCHPRVRASLTACVDCVVR